ncbi:MULTISPECIES: acyl-CoA carboxylase subunit beta [unclassified Variovorax]|uniref:acyl-CoA carboxylase subunit beta n=1 Tax=unclassified Variovorax TaxID=663243 RepID=UPI001318F1D3|nr:MULTISPECIES: carboxyl transferase domain-containing protein [unclassified Variovorax]VTU15325.1 Methylmalonyl-CoA carboxyltransferase 12S subunit [Variovorax sp. SRS16]VTU23082.1 Methylmalonyl-CoA carboxyltransferase 12S subunit [Variovorax sp. PBL-E5]
MRTWDEHLERLRAARSEASATTPAQMQRAQARGRMLCRQRIGCLLDPGSFDEAGLLTNSVLPEVAAPADGLVCGVGTIDGRIVCVAADDGSVFGGARGMAAERKLRQLRLRAARDGHPFIWLQEGSGARIQEQMGATFAGAFADPFIDQVQKMSGRVPTIAALLGNCFGQPAFVAALADFVVMTPTAFAGVSGPPIVAAATGENVSPEELGGHRMHAEQTGLVHHVAADELAALAAIRIYLSYFPDHCHQRPPARNAAAAGGDQRDLLQIVPSDLKAAYDMRQVIRVLVDQDSVFEIKPAFGPAVITAYARIDGLPVGLIASQPLHAGGALDPASSDKMASFIAVAESFQMPLVFLQDVPGFLVGSEVERQGQVVRATHVLAALARSTTPKFTVILRKAYGLAYMVMCGYPVHPRSIVAWPTASISQMGPGPGVNVIFHRQIAAAQDPDATRAQLGEEFEKLLDPYIAARHGYLDDIIDPRETRTHLSNELARAYSAWRPRPGSRPC